MSKIRLHTVFPIAGLALAVGLFVAGGSMLPAEAEAGKNDCSSTLKMAKVKAACKQGGKKAAKKLMKKVVKQSRKDGNEKTCLDCHKNLKTFKLKKNAATDLKPILAKVK